MRLQTVKKVVYSTGTLKLKAIKRGTNNQKGKNREIVDQRSY